MSKTTKRKNKKAGIKDEWKPNPKITMDIQREEVFTLGRKIDEKTRETVKVQCPSCGELVNIDLIQCPNCNGLLIGKDRKICHRMF
jgi:predicted RNA-binding Zn-ribbon protein involved in translation (DUF1610 family)